MENDVQIVKGFSGIVQEKPKTIDVFKWQKYTDQNSQIWVVTLSFGYTNQTVELLDVKNERTVDLTRPYFRKHAAM